MIPPLWPWKIITLPARGPRPTLKGESQLTLRLMDDVQMQQVAQTFGPDWHFFGGPRPQNEDYRGSLDSSPNRDAAPGSQPVGSGLHRESPGSKRFLRSRMQRTSPPIPHP